MSVEFLKAVLPTTGYYCLVLLPEGRHLWTASVDELSTWAERYAGRTGVYFGTASFASDASRKSVNVLALRALRLDIDAGEKKHAKDPEGTYPSQKDALVALRGFIAATGVKPSFILSSGQGLHVYYCLSSDHSPSAWAPVAAGLQALCVERGLRVDPTVTCDTARILRPVGGLHSGESRVRILAQTGAVYALSDLATKFAVEEAPLPTRKYDTSINDDAISTVEGPPSSAVKITEHCAALRHVAQLGGDVQEPLWRAMLGLVKFTVEGDEQAHEWSQGYDGYDERETQRKIDGWATGPATCTEFSKHCEECGSCKYKGQIKSPIVLGRMTAEQVEQLPEDKKPAPPPPPETTGKPWEGRIPEGFDVVEVKGVTTLIHYMTVEQETETGDKIQVRVKVPISHEVFWFDYWSDADTTGDKAVLVLRKWDDVGQRTKTYSFDSALLASRADSAKKLGELGIQITTDKRALSAMEAYLKAEFQMIKTSHKQRITDRFGLRVLEDGRLVSAHGRYVIFPNGEIQRALLGNALAEVAQSFCLPITNNGQDLWPVDVWDQSILPAARRHADFMRQHYGDRKLVKYQLAFMLGLASPLMAFVEGSYRQGATLPPNGLSVSLYEREGGRGKTTLMKAAMLAYGNPTELSREQNTMASTDFARVAKLSLFGTMPASFDEMGRMDEKATAELITAVANGSSRERLSKDGSLRTATRWALICLVATNRSQRDMITVSEAESTAPQYRLLELDVSNMPEFDREQRDKFAVDWAEIQGCAGALGAVLQREICALGVERINKLVIDCVAKASSLVESNREDRFQYRGLGALLAAQLLLKKVGLDMFDVKALFDCFKEVNELARSYIKENSMPTDGVELLERALHDMRPNTVVTETRGWTKGTGAKHYAVHLGQSMPRTVDVRFIKDEGVIYVRSDALKEWCRANKVPVAMIAKQGAALGIVRSPYFADQGKRLASKFNLLTGMAESTGTQVYCYAVQARALAMRGKPTSDNNVVELRPEPAAETADVKVAAE